MRTLLVVLALLSSCRRGLDPAACRSEATALADLLRKADRGPQLFLGGQQDLVVRKDLPDIAPPFAEVVNVERGGLRVSGRRAGNATELAEALREVSTRNATFHRENDLVHLAIDASVSWQEVVRAVSSVHEAGYTRVGFVFSQPRKVAQPARSWADDELDVLMKRDPSDRATELARLAERVAKPCAPLMEAFGSVAAGAPESKSQRLIDALERALPACECKLDLPALRSVMFRVLSDPNPTSAVVKRLSPDGRALIDAPATEWREAAKRITGGDEPIWLTAH